jgi:DNA-binding SARP family transcriptional activator
MRFHILGPLEVHHGDTRVDVVGAKRQAVLGTLLLHAGEAVSIDRLVDTLWGEKPPRSAPSNLRTYLTDLRRTVGRSARFSNATGYRIDVDPDEVDLRVFERLVDRGEAAARDGDPRQAVELLERAVGLWRGSVLGGLELGSWADAARTVVEERRWAALSTLVDAKVVLGQHEGVIARLRGMVAERPLSERTRAQLVLTLHRAGRTADALAEFAQARAVLRAELGLDPGPELRDAQQQVLADSRVSALRRPRCLPAEPTGFVGRTRELADLDTAIRSGVGAVVSGAPGVGKTALVLRAAHRLAQAFPDGHLHHRLGAHDTGAVLGEFLCALGVARRDVPAGVQDRAMAYRSLLADRRMLIVLDDAADMTQVRPLLPGVGACRVLVSSRVTPSGVDGLRSVRVDPLDRNGSIDLLGALAGQDRLAREPEALAAVVRACAGSPLALRIAGARLAVRPDIPVARLAERLSDETTLLDELAIEGLSVRASFAASYRALSADARAVLRAASMLGQPDFTASVLAMTLDVTEQRLDRAVEELVLANLLDTLHGRYRLGRLMRLCAGERAAAEDPPRNLRCIGPARLPHGLLPVPTLLEAASDV